MASKTSSHFSITITLRFHLLNPYPNHIISSRVLSSCRFLLYIQDIKIRSEIVFKENMPFVWLMLYGYNDNTDKVMLFASVVCMHLVMAVAIAEVHLNCMSIIR